MTGWRPPPLRWGDRSRSSAPAGRHGSWALVLGVVLIVATAAVQISHVGWSGDTRARRGVRGPIMVPCYHPHVKHAQRLRAGSGALGSGERDAAGCDEAARKRVNGEYECESDWLLDPPNPRICTREPLVQVDVTVGNRARRGPAKLVLFYHTFTGVPLDVYEDVTSEQLMTLRESGMEAMLDEVRYTTFGANHSARSLPAGRARADPAPIAAASRDKYVRVASGPEGQEGDTIALLYAHCVAQPRDFVAYMHTKGTWHASEANTRLRRLLTWALSRKECVEDALMRGDVCGPRFSLLPSGQYSGNMWWARCDHVARLPEPLWFERHNQAFWTTNKPLLSESFVGLGRMAFEHWVTMHPAVVPMDILALPPDPNLGPYLWGYGPISPDPSAFSVEVGTGPTTRVNMDIWVLSCLVHTNLENEFEPCVHWLDILPSMKMEQLRTLYGDQALLVPPEAVIVHWYERLRAEALRQRDRAVEANFPNLANAWTRWMQDYDSMVPISEELARRELPSRKARDRVGWRVLPRHGLVSNSSEMARAPTPRGVLGGVKDETKSMGKGEDKHND